VIYGRFEIGRGCPYACSYCINGRLHELHENEKRHVRYKTPGRIIEELKYGLQKTGCDIFRFVDETFTAMSENYLSEFVELYKTEIRRPMVIATRPETVSRRKMEILRDAHEDIQVTMGIESGSEKIRKNVCDRHMSNRTIIEAFRICREMGFHTASFNMIGLPGETRDDFMQTVRLNREAKVDTPMLSFFYPFPGTKLREHCIENGYISDEIHEVDYAVSSVLKMPDFTVREMEGLKRTFVLYIKMDESYYPDIFRAEKDDEVFSDLVRIYNEEYYCSRAQLGN
ncbi:MAG: radical SAM protein, partial [Nitrospirota bacterium]